MFYCSRVLGFLLSKLHHSHGKIILKFNKLSARTVAVILFSLISFIYLFLWGRYFMSKQLVE